MNSSASARMGIRGAIFDLDDVLLDRRPAWAYTIEQALLSVTGNRFEPMPLVAEYRDRPWREALRVLEADGEKVAAATELCEKMWERSALKRITVHDGIGMALGALLAAGIYMAAVTAIPLSLARRQAQAAGVDRFLVALEPAPGTGDDDDAGYDDLAEHLSVRASDVAYVSGNPWALQAAERQGMRPYLAEWASLEAGPFLRLQQPSDLRSLRNNADFRAAANDRT